MSKIRFYLAGSGPAVQYAGEQLALHGIEISRELQWNTGHVLLDVPSFTGCTPDTLLSSLPHGVHIWGGKLEGVPKDSFTVTDLLKDESYLLENAAITADCAMELAAPLLTTPISDSPALIIGWGQIGKCLERILRDAGCPVTVMTRQEKILSGIKTVRQEEINGLLPDFRLIFNTAPAPVLTEEQTARCRNCVKIDLASVRGIAGADVIHARGLPGKMAPDRSGKLIAETIINRLKEEVS